MRCWGGGDEGQRHDGKVDRGADDGKMVRDHRFLTRRFAWRDSSGIRYPPIIRRRFLPNSRLTKRDSGISKNSGVQI